MPTIEVNKKDFWSLLGKEISCAKLEELLTVAKAELKKEDEDSLSIELTDTNRPDLWTSEGLARALNLHEGRYSARPFLDVDAKDEIVVSPEMLEIRPYILGFKASRGLVTEPHLLSLIQTQEKLCDNFGHGRASVAIGVYRGEQIEFPVFYRPGAPDDDFFVPLGMGRSMTLREILRQHPKGKDYAHLIDSMPLYPFLEDSVGEVLSMPPIINSDGLGNVRTGDVELFVEMTGTSLRHLQLCATIMASDLSDRGWTVVPVFSVYPYETEEMEGSTRIVAPKDMGVEMKLEAKTILSCLGTNFEDDEVKTLLEKAGHEVGSLRGEGTERVWTLKTPPYRDDCMHQVDLIEDLAIQRGYDSFDPVMPEDFTVGRLDQEELLGDAARSVMVGAGYQECMSPILSSQEFLGRKMNRKDTTFLEIDNVMSLQYGVLRDTLLPSLLSVEAASGKAVYPHKIFELGEVARKDTEDAVGTSTRTHLGCLYADAEASVSEIQSLLDVLSHFIESPFSLRIGEHSSFMEGRFAEILHEDMSVGKLGELHPEVLFHWGIGVPCSCLEIDLTALL